MSKFIDIHILQSVPASCINRDDSGQPKTVTYGGALRSRVSSQAWKRATRMRFEQESESIATDEEFLKTYGTKNLVRLIAREMQAQKDDLDENEALDTAKECLSVALSTSKFESGKGKDTYQTKTRYVMSLGQIRNLAKYCLTHNQSDFTKDKTEIKKLVTGKNSLALSLFGRMVADDESLNVDASCQVAHAFTVNAVQPQFDYFTAVDDFSDQQGSAFIQSAGYSTGVFYRYANINVRELEHNLGNEELTKLGLKLFLKDFALSMPTGKENSFANMDTYITKLTALAHKNVSALKEAKAKPAKLNIDHWGEFKISDIYEYIEHPAARSKKHYESGNVPFIASGAINNGIDCYLAPKNKQDIDKGNCLTISPVDGSCFYQPNDFLGRGGGGSAISILRTNKLLSQATHVFLASIISHTLKEQYSFGNMGNTQKIKDTIIKLPIDAKGEPDWEYMSNQVRHLATLGDITITSLNPAKLPIFVGEWKEFEISRLCYVLKGHRLTKKNMIDGNIRYIGASYSNNGITHMIGNTEYLFPANTITMAYNGSIGAAFYQDQEYWATDDINVIKPKMKLTQNQIFFLMTCIQQKAQSFSFVNKWTQAKMLNTVIKLPVDFNGDPDWQYMDQYISWIKQYSKNKLTLIQ